MHDLYIITGHGDAKTKLAKRMFGYDSHINPTSVPDDGLPVIITSQHMVGALAALTGLHFTAKTVTTITARQA